MDFNDPAQLEVFLNIHRGLPREGPGSRACTRRALELCGPLPDEPRVLDIGCGPGMQTMDLALLLPRAQVTAIDLRPQFVERTRRLVADQGWSDRIEVLEGDMRALPFGPIEPGGIDLLWCEGAAYIMGVVEALTAWRPLLRSPHGRLALTELTWLRSDVPEDLRRGWERDYPAITDIDGCRARIEKTGFSLLGDFVLPESSWWNDYYEPLEARLDQLASAYADDPVAQPILAEHRDELAMYRKFSKYYGYVFFVMGL